MKMNEQLKDIQDDKVLLFTKVRESTRKVFDLTKVIKQQTQEIS